MRNAMLALEAFVTLAWARILWRIAPTRVLGAAIADRDEGRDPDPQLIEIFQRVSSRSWIAHNCIHRALALQWMLARRQTNARFCIGVGEKPCVLPGHAWLEIRGQILNDAPELVRRYTPLIMPHRA